MKIMTIVGTRPELIRLSIIIPQLDKFCDHILVHTGQNFSENLNDIFFRDLKIRKPDYLLGIRAESFGEQIGKILIEGEKVIRKEKPDRILLLGDTNSSLISIIAKRLMIPVYHMEAGNRCYDEKVPEEVNRKIIDHSSTILLPYTNRSKENLVSEGISLDRIYVTGNPIKEVLNHYHDDIEKSNILNVLKLKQNKYFLVTFHREENVDNEHRLENILSSLQLLQSQYDHPVICSVHPRTKKRMKMLKKETKNQFIKYLEPLSFFDFVTLELNAKCVVTDSGTVQEECCIFKKPNVTIRDVTERPETLESGSNIISGLHSKNILESVNIALNTEINWDCPIEYKTTNVSDIVTKILLSHNKYSIN